jgi:hypothetical protein
MNLLVRECFVAVRRIAGVRPGGFYRIGDGPVRDEKDAALRSA